MYRSTDIWLRLRKRQEYGLEGLETVRQEVAEFCGVDDLYALTDLACSLWCVGVGCG